MSGRDSDSFGIYIHVPFCKHECPYCDFYKMELRDRPARVRLDFPGQIAAELALYIQENPQLAGRRLDTIYFGGGTPSTLVPEGVGELIVAIRESFAEVSSDLEVTLEANPENLTEGRCAKWAAAGINRLSIGVQSFDKHQLEVLERLHQPELIPECVQNAREAGFGNISLDLMFALPGQTLDGWKDSLDRALALSPEHISLYGLTYHESTPFFARQQRGELAEIDEDLQAEMYALAADGAAAAGFEHYEISNFARPGFRSQHNQRYWTRADVLGLGPGAHSNIGPLRWANPEDLDAWAAAIARGDRPRNDVVSLAEDITLDERLYTLLRRKEGVSAQADPTLYERCCSWYRQAGIDVEPLGDIDEEAFRLTLEGWLLSDSIVEAILRT